MDLLNKPPEKYEGQYWKRWLEQLTMIVRKLQSPVLFDHYDTVSNSGVAETDLYSDSIPLNTLLSDGQKLSAIYAGTFANTANNKFVKVYFNGSAVFDTGSTAFTALSSWEVRVTIVRTSATTCRVTASFISSHSALRSYSVQVDLAAQNFAQANILKITGAGGASADVSAKLGFVEWKPEA